jgi:hypothetical protein
MDRGFLRSNERTDSQQGQLGSENPGQNPQGDWKSSERLRMMAGYSSQVESSHTQGAGLQGQDEPSSRHLEEIETGSPAESRAEASSSSNNQGFVWSLINPLRNLLGYSEKGKDHEIKVENTLYVEKAINILNEKFEFVSEERVNLLKCRSILKIAKEMTDKLTKEEYEREIYNILDKAGDSSFIPNTNSYLYNAVAIHLQCAFTANKSLNDISIDIDDKIKEINKEILEHNEEYKKFKENFKKEYTEYGCAIDNIYFNSEKIRNRFGKIEKNMIKRIIYRRKVKESKDLKSSVLTRSNELKEEINHKGVEIGLFSNELDNEKTRFDPSKKEVECFHADDPDWEKYKRRMEGLRDRLDGINKGNAQWYEAYKGKWERKIQKLEQKWLCIEDNTNLKDDEFKRKTASLEKKIQKKSPSERVSDVSKRYDALQKKIIDARTQRNSSVENQSGIG